MLNVSQTDEGVGMIVFILKFSELGSDRSQDDAVCHWRMFIFLDEGNISKLRRHLKTCFWTRMYSQRTLCINQVCTIVLVLFE